MEERSKEEENENKWITKKGEEVEFKYGWMKFEDGD